MKLKESHKKVIEKIEDFLLNYKFYLAGGTAIYYYLNHRESEDLDFFTNYEVNFIKEQFRFKDYRIDLIKNDTLYINIENIKISLFYYPYPLIYPLKKINNIYIADLKDILLMKIIAIIQRGSKKDFIDVYFILKELNINLEQLIDLFKQKYGNYNKTILLKALVYFDDADNEIMPNMIKKINWGEIKKFFIKEFTNIKI